MLSKLNMLKYIFSLYFFFKENSLYAVRLYIFLDYVENKYTNIHTNKYICVKFVNFEYIYQIERILFHFKND